MTLYVDPAKIVWSEFAGLEPPQESWRAQFPYWEDYVRKFFASNGLPFVDGDSNVDAWLMSDDRAPFAAMVEALLPDLQARADLTKTEVILFAHWLPDLHLGTSVTNFTMHQLGLEDCFGFAISDRGLSAPFFAFDSLYRYLLAQPQPEGRRGLLCIADQKHVMYRSDLVEALNPKNAACLVAVETGQGQGMAYAGYRRKRIGPDGVAAALAAAMQELQLVPSNTLLIGPKSLTEGLTGPAGALTTDEQLICSAPFAAFASSTRRDCDHLLMCRDDEWLSFLGFRAAQEVQA